MKKSQIILRSLTNALATFAYVACVSWFMFNGEDFFNGKDSFLIPVFILSLFVISASITSLLVLGKPIQMYLSNLKKEAVALLFSTLGWMIVFLLILLTFLLSH